MIGIDALYSADKLHGDGEIFLMVCQDWQEVNNWMQKLTLMTKKQKEHPKTIIIKNRRASSELGAGERLGKVSQFKRLQANLEGVWAGGAGCFSCCQGNWLMS